MNGIIASPKLAKATHKDVNTPFILRFKVVGRLAIAGKVVD